MRSDPIVIHLHLKAPSKPARDKPCNGCGVCCTYAPCPVGVLVSKRTTGACAALLWSDRELRYHCGVLTDPEGVTGLKSKPLQALVVRIAHRMISAGSGCDCSLETSAVSASRF